MLRKLLWQSQKSGQLLTAAAGALLGLCILLFSVQTYLDLQQVLITEAQLIRPEYLVINKPVSLLSSFRGKAPDFSAREIEEIQSQAFVEAVAPFEPSRFRTYATLSVGSQDMDLRTDLFFEAVPDQYVDVPAEVWQWAPGQGEVPIVVPTDYLNLYNFGFAPSQGLPSISAATASQVRFRLMLYGAGDRGEYVGRIAGFSDRLNSILVPQAFLRYANQRYVGSEEAAPSRLILVTRDPSDPALVQFLEETGYETNQERLRSGRMNLVLQSVFGLLVFVGVLIVGLSLLVFLLTFQLIISRNRSEIQLLLHLGYPPPRIQRVYWLAFAALAVAMGGLSLLIVLSGRQALRELMAGAGFEIAPGLSPWTGACLLLLMALFLATQAWTIRRSIRDLARPTSG